MQFPNPSLFKKKKAGDPILASDWNALVDLLKSTHQGPNMIQTPIGTVSLDPVVTGGGRGSSSLVRGVVEARWWNDADDTYWALCKYRDGDPFDPAATWITDQVVYMGRGQPFAITSEVDMYQNEHTTGYWIGNVVIESNDFANDRQWNAPDCGNEDCGPPIAPDLVEPDWLVDFPGVP